MKTHAATYEKAGISWYTAFVNAEISEMIAGPSPYGNGTRSTSPIIALGESWGYHMGHFMADMKYGLQSAPFMEQDIIYFNGFPMAGFSSHINLLEDFDTDRMNDPFQWIPQGLFYDLIDNRNDQAFGRVNLNDAVSGYNNQQFFNALDDDIRNFQNYRIRLLNENGNSQAAGVNIIFDFYVR